MSVESKAKQSSNVSKYEEERVPKSGKSMSKIGFVKFVLSLHYKACSVMLSVGINIIDRKKKARAKDIRIGGN